MYKKLFWLGLIPLLLLGCQLSSAAQPATPAAAELPETAGQTYPLGDGAYWVYQGTVQYSGGGETVNEETLQWRVEVTETISRSNVTGYRMSGSLYDLAFYAPGKQPSEYAILQVGSSRFYSANLDTYARLVAEDDILVGLVQEPNLFLALPLEAGSRFCEAEQLTRLDESYCWVVGEPETVSLEAAAGGDVLAYPLYYRTNPDQTTVYFAPGIGVVAFTYHHSGSTSDVQMALVEYQAAEAAP